VYVYLYLYILIFIINIQIKKILLYIYTVVCVYVRYGDVKKKNNENLYIYTYTHKGNNIMRKTTIAILVQQLQHHLTDTTMLINAYHYVYVEHGKAAAELLAREMPEFHLVSQRYKPGTPLLALHQELAQELNNKVPIYR
jgi:hypothetical protein